MIYRFLISFLLLAGVSGCGPSYSPDTYASNAAQQAAKVEQGVVVGVRDVAVSASGTVGGLTGAAAGGIAGSQVGVGPVSAFSALGGTLVGGIAGSTVEHVTADTKAFEYIVRKGNGELVSVTQKDKTPLALGQKVLVIAGTQARVVPDYTLPAQITGTKTADTGKTDAGTPAQAKPADQGPVVVPSTASASVFVPPVAVPPLPNSTVSGPPVPEAAATPDPTPPAVTPPVATATDDKATTQAKPAPNSTP